MLMNTITCVSKIFFTNDRNGAIAMILSKVTDDLLFPFGKKYREDFVKNISERLKIRKAILYSPIYFIGFRITQDAQVYITMEISAYMRTIQPMVITINGRKEVAYMATD